MNTNTMNFNRHFVKVTEQSATDCTAPILGNNKIYDIIAVMGRDGEPIAYDCYWGRVPEGYTFGNTSSYAKMRSKRIFPTSLAKTVSDRFAHGYKDLTNLVTKDEIEEAEEKKASEDAVATIKGSSAVKGLFARLFNLAKSSLNDVFKGLTITKAQQKLVEALLNQMTLAEGVDDFNALYKRVLTTIPRRAGNVEALLAVSKNDFDPILNRERQLLDNLKAVNGNAVKTVDGSNIIVTEEVSEEDEKLIRKLLGGHAPELKKIWKVQNLECNEAFAQFKSRTGVTKTRLLWHGTRGENVLSILQSGLKLRPQAKMTGKMFGWGIYFANSADKSLGYTDGGRWARGLAKESRFLILNEVLTGKEYEIRTEKEFRKKHSFYSHNEIRKFEEKGYDSLHAFGGEILRADEIVVYDEGQVRPVFLVELD